jgi:sodium-dependent dicarboxylate transporter 2/3/5
MRLSPARAIGLAAGVVAFLVLILVDTPLAHFGTHGARPAHAAAVAALMALWWLTEAVPIYWTACVPLVAFPLLGIFPGGFREDVIGAAQPYLDPYIFLFAGGMAIAAAMQQWGLHRRIALAIMAAIGTDPQRLLAGLLAATAFISLWISNTATATMMMPIGIALIAQLESQLGRGAGSPTAGLAGPGGRRLQHYGMAIMLAIAYGSNIGGIGTKIGTAPNAQLAGFAERLGIEISFVDFLAVGMPFVALFLPVAWFFLWRVGKADCGPGGLSGDLGSGVITRERAKLGAMGRGERVVLGVFGAAAAAWIGGKLLTGWLKTLPGFEGIGAAHVEAAIALLAAAILLLWRTAGTAVLRPASLRTVPWETLLLLGGGFAMAAGIQGSGLSELMAGQLTAIRELPGFQQVLLASLVTVAISAVASNTATTAVMLVVLRDAASPEVLPVVLFAATIAASCDFALPAGTPPNAIVFGSGYVSIPRMFRTGVVLDLLAALLAAAWCWLAVPRIL